MEFQGVNTKYAKMSILPRGVREKDHHLHCDVGPELPPQYAQCAGYVHRLNLRQILFQVSDARGEHRSWFIRFRKGLCNFYPAACSFR